METLFCADIPHGLKNKLKALKSGQTLPVIINFSERPLLSQFAKGRNSAPEMIEYLKALSEKSIRRLRAAVSKQGYQGTIAPLWITNSVALDANMPLVEMLAKQNFVFSISEDEQVSFDAIDSFENVYDLQAVRDNAGWNIKIIKADSVWLLYGLDGRGVLLGSMDTGIDTSHLSIAAKWRQGGHSWYDAISGRTIPYDDNGHGTLTTGTMIGGDGLGPDTNDIGVAYGATFISAKMLGSGFSSNAQVIGAAQWMLDPDGNSFTNDFPRVINNSWFSNTRGSTWFYEAAAAWRAAGVIPVFCASNFGPSSASTRSPGDYDICISVGGTNFSDGRYGGTSVGPSPTGLAFPEDRRKPDVAAPGDGVRSSVRGGGFASAGGTSMAAPHVSGTIALMVQANPDLTVDEVVDILKRTSKDVGDSGYDYVFGYGRVDALRAVREALKLRIIVTPQGNQITHETGDSLWLSIRLRVAPENSVTVHLSLSDTTEGVILSSGVVEFTPGNWNVSQEILIKGKPDSLSDGNVSYSLVAETISGDLLYNTISTGVATITNFDAQVLEILEHGDMLPSGYSLHQNYPNPFNPVTVIAYEVPVKSYIRLKVYDVFGREVATLVDGIEDAGYKTRRWDASAMPGGVYFYNINIVNSNQYVTTTKKMLLLR